MFSKYRTQQKPENENQLIDKTKAFPLMDRLLGLDERYWGNESFGKDNKELSVRFGSSHEALCEGDEAFSKFYIDKGEAKELISFLSAHGLECRQDTRGGGALYFYIVFRSEKTKNDLIDKLNNIFDAPNNTSSGRSQLQHKQPSISSKSPIYKWRYKWGDLL